MNLTMDDAVVKRVRADASKAVTPVRTDLEWKEIRVAIQRAIAPFPGAHEAVSRALLALCPEFEFDRET